MALRKKHFNLIVDGFAYVGFVFLVTTGFLMRYTLPPGSGHYTTIWGLDRHYWGDIHFWVSIGFLVTLVFHLFLHWQWIVAMISGKPRTASGTRFLMGMAAAIAIVVLGLSPFLSKVEAESGRRNLFRGDRQSFEVQNGAGRGQVKAQREPYDGDHVKAQAESPGRGHDRGSYEGYEDVDIAGYMSLQEVQSVTGVPAEYIVKTLNLPDNIALDERMGRLKREYGFEMVDVKDAVAEYMSENP